MILAIIKKASQNENQTTITTKINYLQNIISIFLINKIYWQGKDSVRKLETKRNTLFLTGKSMGPLHNKA